MANFDQRGQQVGYQYNADTINFGAVQTPEAGLAMLKTLQQEIQKAIDAKAVNGEAAIDLEAHIKKAVLAASQPQPDKKSLVSYLNKAKVLVSGVTGLAAAIGAAIATIGGLF